MAASGLANASACRGKGGQDPKWTVGEGMLCRNTSTLFLRGLPALPPPDQSETIAAKARARSAATTHSWR